MVFVCTQDHLTSKKRKNKIARFMYYYILRYYYCLTLLEISAALQKDHTTIMHGIKVIQSIITSNEAIHKLNKHKILKILSKLDINYTDATSS